MEFVSLKKAVKILGLHENTLRKYADLGYIESIRSEGGKRLFNVQKYIAQKTQESTPAESKIENRSKDGQKDRVERLCALVLERSQGYLFPEEGLERLAQNIVMVSQQKQEEQAKEGV